MVRASLLLVPKLAGTSRAPGVSRPAVFVPLMAKKSPNQIASAGSGRRGLAEALRVTAHYSRYGYPAVGDVGRGEEPYPTFRPNTRSSAALVRS